MTATKKQLRELLDALRDKGATILEVAEGKHLRVKMQYQGKVWTQTLSRSASDHHSYKNFLTDAEKYMDGRYKIRGET